MIEACRQGPSGAQVSAIDMAEADETALAQRNAGEDFSVLPTA
jgi:hypothetical protein